MLHVLASKQVWLIVSIFVSWLGKVVLLKFLPLCFYELLAPCNFFVVYLGVNVENIFLLTLRKYIITSST